MSRAIARIRRHLCNHRTVCVNHPSGLVLFCVKCRRVES